MRTHDVDVSRTRPLGLRHPVSRRGNGSVRCARCRLHRSLCVCALLPRLETRTRLVLVIHRFEERKPTNTGLLAASCLAGSEVHARGGKDDATGPLTWPEGTEPLFLFPYEDACPLDRAPLAGTPVTLIVPDGNWRQASKVYKRVPGLAGVRCVSLPAGAPSSYRLRTEAHAKGLSTIEAIARAFGILEGPAVQRALEQVQRTMVERTLWARGSVGIAAVTSGVPAGVKRHDPRSGDSPEPLPATPAQGKAMGQR
jgi:DTW domain-containing protein YfiP